MSPELAPRVRALDDGVRLRLAKLIVARCPHMRQNDVLRYAEVCVQIMKGLLPLALHGSASKRRAGTREMKLVLERYLAPIEAEERGESRRETAQGSFGVLSPETEHSQIDTAAISPSALVSNKKWVDVCATE